MLSFTVLLSNKTWPVMSLHSFSLQHKSNKELRAFLFNDFLLLCRQQGSNTLARTFTNIFKDNPEGEATLSIYKKVCTMVQTFDLSILTGTEFWYCAKNKSNLPLAR